MKILILLAGIVIGVPQSYADLMLFHIYLANSREAGTSVSIKIGHSAAYEAENVSVETAVKLLGEYGRERNSMFAEIHSEDEIPMGDLRIIFETMFRNLIRPSYIQIGKRAPTLEDLRREAVKAEAKEIERGS